MKSQFQVLSLLSQYRPKTDLDGEMISSFIEKRFTVSPKSQIFSDKTDADTIDSQTFLEWFDGGFGCFDIAVLEGSPVLLGKCSTTVSNILCVLNGGQLTETDKFIPASSLKKCENGEAELLERALLESGKQPNHFSGRLSVKHIPRDNERVVFYNFDRSVQGIGVVRFADVRSGGVELYCYFIYPSKTEAGKIGYSMHERETVNLYEYNFEKMTEGKKGENDSLNGVYCMQRLNRELEKVGKVWKNRVRRIEPVSYVPRKGKRYWYITDKLKVVPATDNDTSTSRQRQIAGNYFVDPAPANIMLAALQDAILRYLSSDRWPEIDIEP